MPFILVKHKIGGIDNPVVKDALNEYPYIPGSSIKGKVRTLLEWFTGNVDPKGKPYSTKDSENPIARIFGNGSNENDYKGGPTRVSFSDCKLKNAKELLEKNALTETKAEVSIDRMRGTASGAGPRHMERVPAGAIFDFQFSYKIFDMGDDGEADKENFDLLLKGLKLLEMDSLGGSGSRGYGKIEFKFEDKNIQEKFDKITF
jgi:CRISPR-associated protein Csm3